MKKTVSFTALLLAVLLVFTSCIGQTKAEKDRTRIEQLYDDFHQSLLRGTLSADYGGERLFIPLEEKLIEDAARSYPAEKRGPFYFDTVKFTDAGELAFISTEDTHRGVVFAIVQEADGAWYFHDGGLLSKDNTDAYVSPLVTNEISVTRDIRNEFTIPSEWTVLAESELQQLGTGTFYFINITKSEMIRHFDSCMNEGDVKEVVPGFGDIPAEELDEDSGDVMYAFFDEGGNRAVDVLVWELWPSTLDSGKKIDTIMVVDIQDYRKMAPEFRDLI